MSSSNNVNLKKKHKSYNIREFFSHSLQLHIVTIFLIVMVTTFGTIIGYTYHRNSSAVLNLGKDFLQTSRKTIINKMQLFLRRAQIYSSLLAQIYNSREEVNPENINITNYMRELLRNNPEYHSVYTATLDGKFLQMRQASSNESYYSNPLKKLPPETFLALRYIDGGGNNSREIWNYQNNVKKILDTEILPETTMHVVSRPWFTEVIDSQKSEWTDLYMFFTSKKPGLTVSTPVFHTPDQNLIGVVGIDIDASRIGDLLKEEKISKYCDTIVFNSKLEVITSNKTEDAVSIEDDKVHTTLINQLSNPKIVEAYNIYAQKKEPIFNFIFQDVEYIACFDDFPIIESFDETGRLQKAEVFKNWKIAFIVPIDEFIGSIKKVRKDTLIMTLILFALATIIMAFIIKRISKPIVKLAKEASKIREFKLDSQEEIKTSVIELQQLNDSIVSMRQSMRSFAKFIPKVLVGKLLKSQGEVRIGGHQRKITLLFTDVANFTTVCEGYPADKLANHLSEYFEEVTQIIMDNDGVIDKYIGDAVMAFWGAPIQDRDQTLSACKAALYLQKRIGDLNRKWEAERKPLLKTRIGIHTGDAIVGNIGSSDRMNYTALGDSVNLAARLEGTNKFYHTNIIISHEVYKEIENFCLVRPLDIVAVKGKNEGVKIYELVCLSKGDPALLPTQDQIKFCEAFTKAFNLYIDQRWDEAIHVFTEIEEKFGNAHTTTMYIKRCRDFKKTPPPIEWDGIYHLKEK